MRVELRTICLPMLIGVSAMLGGAVAASADTVVFGQPGTGSNVFPFGGYFNSGADEYQQVYNSAHFTAGPMVIRTISFFDTINPGGDYSGADYELSLSTTSKAVNGLDTFNLADNLGTDNQLFYSAHLSGPLPSTITFSGTPFNYDPSQGNLLLDVKVSNRTDPAGGNGALDARNGDFGTDSSRAHNFGTAFESWGLVTAFSGGNQAPDTGSTTLLLGTGLLGLGWLRRKV